MKPINITAIFVLSFGLSFSAYTFSDDLPFLSSQVFAADLTSDQLLDYAFKNRRSKFVIEGQGVVIKLLPDDLNGTRHQRFLLKLRSGQILLVAHNLELAKRVANLKVGSIVQFKGQYEWNAKGGVIHWTHHDPSGQHASGWLRLGRER